MNKTVLITGAASGIGAGLASFFAEAGYNIAINTRRPEDLETRGKELAEVCEKFGVKARCFVGDVANFDDCKKMAGEVKEEFGTIDVLINNAGITKDTLLVRMKEQDYLDVIGTNLNGVFNMCKNVVPVMTKQRSGSIINMSSIVGINGNAGQTNYAAAKAGVIGFTKALAKEVGGRGIVCNAIAPGFVTSPMTDKLKDKHKSDILSAIVMRRFGTNEDIGEAALFLAKTTYITGQVISVDGGLRM